MKLKYFIFNVFFALLISGCSTEQIKRSFTPDFNYFTDTIPTLDSLKTTNHKSQIYRKTAFFEKDFKSSGELKTIYDYDFTKEDAPCTVLGDIYHEAPIFKESFYNVKLKNNKEFIFHCRPNNETASATQFRLYLIGSYHDCNSRRWDYSKSSFSNFKNYGKQCATGFKTKENKNIEKEYKESFFNI